MLSRAGGQGVAEGRSVAVFGETLAFLRKMADWLDRWEAVEAADRAF